MRALPRDSIWTRSVLPPDRRQPWPSEEEGADGSGGEEGSKTKESLHVGVNQRFPQAGLKEGAGSGGEGPKRAKKWLQNQSDWST